MLYNAGLRRLITDNSAIMWVAEASEKKLEEESNQKSLPECVYENISKLKIKGIDLVQAKKRRAK